MKARSFSIAIATGVMAAAMAAAPVAAGGGGAATVWVAHGIPGAKVDVCVGGDAVRTDFKYGQRFKAVLPAAQYTINVRLDAKNDCRGDLVIRQTVGLTPGLNATAVAVVKGSTPQLAIYVNDAAPPITAGEPPSAITVIHEAAAPAVDVWLAKTVRVVNAAVAGTPDLDPTLSGVSRGDQAGPLAIPSDVYSYWVALSGDPRAVIGPKQTFFKPTRAYTVIAVGTNPDNFRFIVFSNQFQL